MSREVASLYNPRSPVAHQDLEDATHHSDAGKRVCVYFGLCVCEHLWMPGVKRILVADDDPLLRTLFEESLAQEGFNVAACGNGNSTMASIATFQPAIVVLDSELPPMGAWPIVERLRDRGLLTPVIMLASGRNRELQEVCARWPGVQCLAKPFGLQEFLQAVART